MLDGIPLLDLTPSVLLGIVVLFVILGRLVPRATLVDKAAEAERWRLAYEAERQARTLADAQTTELLEVAKATHGILDAIVNEADTAPRGGAHRVVVRPTSVRNNG